MVGATHWRMGAQQGFPDLLKGNSEYGRKGGCPGVSGPPTEIHLTQMVRPASIAELPHRPMTTSRVCHRGNSHMKDLLSRGTSKCADSSGRVYQALRNGDNPQ